jgi:ParB family chromosome partitioning protein
MTSSRQALGRGLSSLIPKADSPAAPGIETVDVDLIVPNPYQPRQRFDPVALQGLADSIREHGVLQPVVVTQVKSDTGLKTYQIIAGERRLQAARIAGIERMPVVVKDVADVALLELALVENLQRQDLNPLEEAYALRRLAEEFGLTQDQVAKRVGRSRASITNTLRLLTLHDDILQSLASGQISEGHARTLLAIDDDGERLDTWRKIVSGDLSVREAEEIAKALRAMNRTTVTTPKSRSTSETAAVDPNIRALEDDLRHALGQPVSLKRTSAGRGTVTIWFHSDEELDKIIGRIVENRIF